MNLAQWIKQITQLDEFDIAGIVYNQFDGPNYDEILLGHSFAASFQRPQIILALEVWSIDSLIDLQTYLRQKTCNIENFYITSAWQPRLATWWNNYCSSRVYNQRTFNIVEVFDIPFHDEYLQSLEFPGSVLNFWKRDSWYTDCYNIDINSTKELNYYFSYMCGTGPGGYDIGYAKHYLALQMLQFEPDAVVSLAWSLIDKHTLKSFVDYSLYWQDQDLVDLIDTQYQKVEKRPTDQIPIDNFVPDSGKFYKNSFATVVRESFLTQPFGAITEKSLRALLAGQFIIPTTHLGVADLEDRHFQFDHNLFDYSYQFESNFIKRINLLCQSLREFIKSYSLQDLDLYRQTHLDMFIHNQNLAVSQTNLFKN